MAQPYYLGQSRYGSSVLHFRHDAGSLYAEEMEDFGFGERLRNARKAKGLSQTDLGKGLGADDSDVSKQSVAGWEAGRHYPKADQLRTICSRLQITADSLLFGDITTPSAKVQHAADALKDLQLSEEERLQLFAVMTGPHYDDAQVERMAPITASLKKQTTRN